ncbi:MAG: hypothetical protein AAF333_00890 [Planctomycetota bacterium]
MNEHALPPEPLANTRKASNASASPRPTLEFCPSAPDIMRRHEAWWARDAIDRPLLIISADRNPARPLTRRLDLLDTPETWLREKTLDLKQTYFTGDALPNIRVDFGPTALSGMLGGRVEVTSDSVWTHPSIEGDWPDASYWALDEDSIWWKRLRQLTALAAECAAGKFLVMAPDLGGTADTLAGLRDSQRMCFDIMEQPQYIVEALETTFPLWQRVFETFYAITRRYQAGTMHWVQLWSDRPYVVPTCDFNTLIGPKTFREIFVPDLVRLGRAAGRMVFHLDGPEATRHVEALLEIPELDAIQFTIGAAAPSALPWIPMFRRIQASDKSLLAVCPYDEVVKVCQSLDPRGLAIWTVAPTPAEADSLVVDFLRHFGEFQE